MYFSLNDQVTLIFYSLENMISVIYMYNYKLYNFMSTSQSLISIKIENSGYF